MTGTLLSTLSAQNLDVQSSPVSKIVMLKDCGLTEGMAPHSDVLRTSLARFFFL